MQNDVKVVNHQVKYDTDFRAARIERRKPVHFYEYRLGQYFLNADHRRIEPFDMAHLEHPVILPRQVQQLIRLSHC